jgi:hypothetical protein
MELEQLRVASGSDVDEVVVVGVVLVVRVPAGWLDGDADPGESEPSQPAIASAMARTANGTAALSS